MEGDPKQISLVYKTKGNEFFQNKEYEKALDLYTKAIVKKPEVINFIRKYMTKTPFTSQIERQL